MGLSSTVHGPVGFQAFTEIKSPLSGPTHKSQERGHIFMYRENKKSLGIGSTASISTQAKKVVSFAKNDEAWNCIVLTVANVSIIYQTL